MSFGFSHGAIQWLSTDAATTTYTVSGLSFQPKAIRFYCQGIQSAIDAVSEAANERMSIGFAVSTSSRRCVSAFDTDAAGSMACGRGAHDAAVLATVTAAGAFDGLLDLSSITSDGFVLIVDDAAPVSLTVFWEAWGGTDITVATIVDIATPASSPSDSDITVTGFTATGTDQVVMFLCNGNVGTTLPLAEAESSKFGVGFASSGDTNNNISIAGLNDNGSASADSSSYALTGECLTNLDDATSTAPRVRAYVSQWNANGFRVHWLERWNTGVLNFALAVKGGQWYAGSYTIAGNSANATTAVTAPGFQPVGICFIGSCKIADTTNVATVQQHIGFGTASSTSSRRAMGFLGEDGNTDSQCNFTIQYDQCLSFASSAGGLLSAYDIQSIDATGFTVIVDTAGGVANEWQGYLAFAGVGVVVETITSITKFWGGPSWVM